LNDEQETIKHPSDPSVVSGCVENFLQINYKNPVDTMFYKIRFNCQIILVIYCYLTQCNTF